MKKIGLYMYWQADWATISRLIAEICIAFLAWIEMNWKRNILLFLRGKFPGHQLVGVLGNLPISLNRETKQEEIFVGEKKFPGHQLVGVPGHPIFCFNSAWVVCTSSSLGQRLDANSFYHHISHFTQQRLLLHEHLLNYWDIGLSRSSWTWVIGLFRVWKNIKKLFKYK